MFHAKGMAGAKALRQAHRGRPAWLEQSEPCLRTIWGYPATGKGQRRFQVGRAACAKTSGKRQALSVFQSISPYLILEQRCQGKRVDFFFHFTAEDLKL